MFSYLEYIERKKKVFYFISKHRDIKINEQIQQLRQKTFFTSNEEPIVHTQDHIDPHYIQIMNKNQQNLIRYDSQQNHLIDEDEER